MLEGLSSNQTTVNLAELDLATAKTHNKAPKTHNKVPKTHENIPRTIDDFSLINALNLESTASHPVRNVVRPRTLLELGSGDFMSIVQYQEKSTLPGMIATEIRTQGEIEKVYGVNISKIRKTLTHGREASFGVDATNPQHLETLGKTLAIRLTNINLGDEDISPDMFGVPERIEVKTFGLRIHIHSDVGQTNKDIKKLISHLRNTKLMFDIFKNLRQSLISGGRVEVILKEKFYKAWNIEDMAKAFGFTKITEGEFTDYDHHVKTQKAEQVSHKSSKPHLYTFRDDGRPQEEPDLLVFLTTHLNKNISVGLQDEYQGLDLQLENHRRNRHPGQV